MSAQRRPDETASPAACIQATWARNGRGDQAAGPACVGCGAQPLAGSNFCAVCLGPFTGRAPYPVGTRLQYQVLGQRAVAVRVQGPARADGAIQVRTERGGVLALRFWAAPETLAAA